MALRDVDSESDSTHPVTPMAEIRRHKGMLFDEFTRKYPDWEWSERRRRRLMFDEDGLHLGADVQPGVWRGFRLRRAWLHA